MANLEKLAANYRSEGYSALLAEARVCQDIVLKAISESSLSRNEYTCGAPLSVIHGPGFCPHPRSKKSA